MTDIITRVQKEMNKFQKTFEKESKDLIRRFKVLTNQKNVRAARREIRSILATSFKKFEPPFRKFLGEVKKNAKKAGIDVSRIERQINRVAATFQGRPTRGKTPRRTAKTVHAKARTKAKTKRTTRKKSTATMDTGMGPTVM